MPYASYAHLCRAVSRVPGVVFLKKPRFFWSGENIRAEFQLEGNIFNIEVDSWEAGLWVITKDLKAHHSEMQRLRDAVKKYVTPLGMIGGFLLRTLAWLRSERHIKSVSN